MGAIRNPLYREKTARIVSVMSKLHSGKIRHRVLAAISNTMGTGDIPTLANPDLVSRSG